MARTYAIVMHPSPQPSPRSCLTRTGSRKRCSLRWFRHELSQRRISLRRHLRSQFAERPLPRRADGGDAQVILGRGGQAGHGGLGFRGDGTIHPGGGIGRGGGVLHHIALGPFHPVPVEVDLAIVIVLSCSGIKRLTDPIGLLH